MRSSYSNITFQNLKKSLHIISSKFITSCIFSSLGPFSNSNGNEFSFSLSLISVMFVSIPLSSDETIISFVDIGSLSDELGS